MPVDRIPRPSAKALVVDPGIAWERVEKVRDGRIGDGRQCGNCLCSYEYALAPGGAPSLVCHHSPPLGQLMLNDRGLALQSVPRVVNANFFCHQWLPRPKD
jgi:hypothetical protein